MPDSKPDAMCTSVATMDALAANACFADTSAWKALREKLLQLPSWRPLVDRIDTTNTLVVCRKEVLPEAVAYYRNRYNVLPEFCTMQPQVAVRLVEQDEVCQSFGQKLKVSACNLEELSAAIAEQKQFGRKPFIFPKPPFMVPMLESKKHFSRLAGEATAIVSPARRRKKGAKYLVRNIQKNVHIFTSLTAKVAGHSGLSFLVRQLAERGIFHVSVEKECVEKFTRNCAPEKLSLSDIVQMLECGLALEDEASRQAYWGVCKGRMLGDFSFVSFAPYAQYFHPALPVEAGDVLCEGGICDGKTSVKFARLLGETGQLYGFEPVHECFVVSQRRTEAWSNIRLENTALWRKPERLLLTVDTPSSGYSTVLTDGGPATPQQPDSARNGRATVVRCDATSIDAYFSGTVVPTVIKLDVEGAEMSVLEGAVETIRKYRPKLILSIYHVNGGNDLVNVPAFIKNLDLDYALYVGHHSIWFNETILYAVPR